MVQDIKILESSFWQYMIYGKTLVRTDALTRGTPFQRQ